MGLAVRSDVEVWAMTFVGHAVSWPKKAAIGGIPARIGGKIELVCESSKALLSKDANNDGDERAKCMFLANHTQSLLQANIDDLVKKGYSAGDNTSKRREIEKKKD